MQSDGLKLICKLLIYLYIELITLHNYFLRIMCNNYWCGTGFQCNLVNNSDINHSTRHSTFWYLVPSEHLVLSVQHQQITEFNVIVSRPECSESFGSTSRTSYFEAIFGSHFWRIGDLYFCNKFRNHCFSPLPCGFILASGPPLQLNFGRTKLSRADSCQWANVWFLPWTSLRHHHFGFTLGTRAESWPSTKWRRLLLQE